MKTLLLMLILLLSSTITSGVEVIVPDDEQRTTISVNDPDASVYTLGKPEIFFDLSATHFPPKKMKSESPANPSKVSETMPT